MRTCIALLATAAAAATASAQVVISEVNFSPNQGAATPWIEIHNRGAAGADLSSWSLYYATATPGKAGNYWYGFPPGSALAMTPRKRVVFRVYICPEASKASPSLSPTATPSH